MRPCFSQSSCTPRGQVSIITFSSYHLIHLLITTLWLSLDGSFAVLPWILPRFKGTHWHQHTVTRVLFNCSVCWCWRPYPTIPTMAVRTRAMKQRHFKWKQNVQKEAPAVYRHVAEETREMAEIMMTPPYLLWPTLPIDRVIQISFYISSFVPFQKSQPLYSDVYIHNMCI